MRPPLLPLLLTLGAACRTPARELPPGWDDEHPQAFATRALALDPVSYTHLTLPTTPYV